MKLSSFTPASFALAFGLALSPAHATTTLLESQSPIDIITSDLDYNPALPALQFSYGSSVSLSITDTRTPADTPQQREERTVRADVTSGSNTLTIGGVTYNLLQFHFHTPSEHEVDGVGAPLELHLVHRSAGGALAVVGALVRIGAENTALAAYFNALGAFNDAVVGGVETVASFDLTTILPSTLTSYRYSGSLTTSPFTEPVAWNVLTTPIEVSQTQFDAFSVLFPDDNAREPQPINGRTVVTDLAPVPVPASGLMLLSVAGGLLMARRRRVSEDA